jgi:hypothetical protein
VCDVFHVDRTNATEAISPMTTPTTLPTIQIRAARDEDARLLLRLAAMDSAPALHDPVLIASLDGEPLAALSLRDGRAIADPFRPTADLLELLRTRARLMGARGAEDRRRRPSLRRPSSKVALAR